jgi:hypothetical protein
LRGLVACPSSYIVSEQKSLGLTWDI